MIALVAFHINMIGADGRVWGQSRMREVGVHLNMPEVLN